MSRKPSTLPLGVIFEGTLRPEDLIPAYLDVLDGIRLTKAERLIIGNFRRVFESGMDIPTRGDELLEELTDILSAHVPDYAYFGATEGDGACFGVWPNLEAIRESGLPHGDGEVHTDDHAPTAESIADGCRASFWAYVTDHGNVTLYRRAGNRWIEVWSVI